MSRTLVATTYQSRFFEKKKNFFLKRFLKKLGVNFLENSIFSYGTKLKTKILALICSSAELQLHFKTFPSFLAFEMVEKSWKYKQIKHKKTLSRKTQNNVCILIISDSSIINNSCVKSWKSIRISISHTVFENRQQGLSNRVKISKSMFLTKIAIFDPGGGLKLFYTTFWLKT